MMGSGAPLLNEYKCAFLWRRLPQTILGGPKLKLGQSAPVYVYVIQVTLLAAPVILSIPFTFLVDKSVVSVTVAAAVYGGVAALFVLILQAAVVMLRRKASVTQTPVMAFDDDDDNDDVEFKSGATLDFMFPPKRFKFNIVLHAVFSGAICSLALLYLLPATLNDLYGSTSVTVALSVFGWFAFCVAQYSLTVAPPPEPATLHALDTWEIEPLRRPFYIVLFFCVDIVARTTAVDLTSVSQVLHIVFLFLPLFWTIGLLPPLDVFLLWATEQGYVHLLGGSPVLSNIRLAIILLASIAAYLTAYFVPSGIATSAIMAVIGYALALDFGTLASQLLAHTPLKWWPLLPVLRQHFLWRWSSREVVFHFFMLIGIGVIAVGIGLLPASRAALRRDSVDFLAYCIMGLFVLDIVLCDLQQVYLLFGLFRNPLYPPSVESSRIFNNAKRKLHPLAIIRRAISGFVGPAGMLLYLLFQVDFTAFPLGSAEVTVSKAAVILGMSRAFRWTWQSSRACLLEVSVVHVVTLAVPAASAWSRLGVGLQLLLVSAAVSRVRAAVGGLRFAGLIAWTARRGRQRPSATAVVVSAVLLPVSVVCVFAAAVLDAPLLPLFTLPIFVVGFPRPRWGGEATAAGQADTADGALYEQLTPKLCRVLRAGLASGSLGDPSVGDVYLARCQDRTALLTVLERGYGYVRVVVRGLELQATSCHAVEVTRLDDAIGAAFERAAGGRVWGGVTRWRDAASIRTYSDARGQLTGVLDSPGARRDVAARFPQVLIWLLLHGVRSTRNSQEFAPPPPGGARPQTATSARSAVSDELADWSDGGSTISELEPSPRTPPAAAGRRWRGPMPGALRNSPAAGRCPSSPEARDCLPDASHFASTFSSQFALPAAWRQLPVDAAAEAAAASFPRDWYQHMLRRAFTYEATNRVSEDEVAAEVSRDAVLADAYARLTTTCLAIVIGLDGKGDASALLSMSEIHKLYQGEIPWSTAADWLSDNGDLKAVVIKAFRYAVMLAIDESVLGTADTWDELADALTDYDVSWYIGTDSEPGWLAAIRANQPSLFSFTYDSVNRVYESRRLTLCKVPVYICSLNSASVRGHQAALTFELLYLTNDDEERYSIQANSLTLRNLTMQAADPPLGYPVYTSHGVTVPTL